jgi:hypothetical protein
MSPAKAAEVRDEAAGRDSAVPETAGLNLLAQLLHALNQPLTGLQCSLELALAGRRTPEQYIDCVRGGLDLTERMRNLAAAMRELLEIEAAPAAAAATDELAINPRTDLRSVLRETLAELQPVAETRGVRIALDCGPLPVSVERRTLISAMFRVLESVLSLAAPESLLSIETAANPGSACLRLGWSRQEPAPPPGGFSGPELGLLLAQAGLRRAGVDWKREQKEDLDWITLQVPLHGEREIKSRHGLSGLTPERLKGKDLPCTRNS